MIFLLAAGVWQEGISDCFQCLRYPAREGTLADVLSVMETKSFFGGCVVVW